MKAATITPTTAQRTMTGVMIPLPAKLRRMSKRRQKIAIARRAIDEMLHFLPWRVIGPVRVRFNEYGYPRVEALIQPTTQHVDIIRLPARPIRTTCAPF